MREGGKNASRNPGLQNDACRCASANQTAWVADTYPLLFLFGPPSSASFSPYSPSLSSASQ